MASKLEVSRLWEILSAAVVWFVDNWRWTLAESDGPPDVCDLAASFGLTLEEAVELCEVVQSLGLIRIEGPGVLVVVKTAEAAEPDGSQP